LVFIPGNPGLGHYYLPFLQSIHKEMDHIDIVCCSYPGHTPTSELYSLQEQVDHKISFLDHLNELYHHQTKFYLAAHSLGTYMSLKIMKARPELNIVKVISLFPTMHSMGKTVNARNIKPLTHPISRILLGHVAQVLSFIPRQFVSSIIGFFSSQSQHAMQVSLKYLLDRKTVNSVLYLASCEFEEIDELDHQVLEEHQDKWIMYFGTTDGWCPVDHYHLIKDNFPLVKVHLCKEDIGHAFIMDHSHTMAEKMITWLLE
jgi:pimeloyl-ACP methyl ester carboxylesterase